MGKKLTQKDPERVIMGEEETQVSTPTWGSGNQ